MNTDQDKLPAGTSELAGRSQKDASINSGSRFSAPDDRSEDAVQCHFTVLMSTPVIEVCDASEALGFTLCAESAAGVVQPFQASIFFWLHCYFNLKLKVSRRRILQNQVLFCYLVLAG